MRATAAVALGLEGDVKLAGEGDAGEGEVHPLGFAEDDSHVLNKMLHEETGVEIAGDDAGAEVGEGPAAGGAGSDRLQDGGEVEAGFVGVEEGLADADHVARDERLVDRLGVLAGAGATLMDDGFAHRFPAGLQGIYYFLVAADHDREAG